MAVCRPGGPDMAAGVAATGGALALSKGHVNVVVHSVSKWGRELAYLYIYVCVLYSYFLCKVYILIVKCLLAYLHNKK